MIRSGIYCIKNTVNGKVYIGSAVDINHRWTTHRLCLRKLNHHSILLQRAWDKYGEAIFEFVILEEIQNRSKLIGREQYWMNKYKSYSSSNGYNINPTAGSNLGLPSYKRTAKHRKKMSLALLGKKKSIIHRQNLSKACLGRISGMLGKKHSSEALEKMRQKKLGNKFGLGNKNFLGKIPWNKGIKWPRKQLEKFRKSRQRG